MLDRLSRFYRLNTGYEKTLRLIQAICLIALELGSLDSATTKRVQSAKTQLALTRRCIRFWNFLDCFNRVSALLGAPSSSTSKSKKPTASAVSPTGVLWMLDLAKWSCFGLYYLLEDLTLLDAANIYPVPWAKSATSEAYRFWFCALVISILGAVWEGMNAGAVKGARKGKKGGTLANARKVDMSALVKRVVVDGCDLLIPGSYLGWIGVGQVGVGGTMVVSTLLSLREIWRSV
ncbi:PEX11 domain protein [Aspergillus homomorphus CBS 101889]|uniref:PEX11 domain protein n=1 Tax=Aspergillus homomorphus (strain CBS 101889) TaxID=1450537 RepID=A0A395I0X3_ASPHC|nr:hypothetical protein BO97DRAFT_389140 [Aspergillus homomorphus CBS 101889]RAL13263.1 hypothetical protein BO97DRAFT_389140 [Aspergillus homomorphus CBS 101889]